MTVEEESKAWKRRVEAVLLPLNFRVGLVTRLFESVSIIWYWGANETGFASGRTPEDAADMAIKYVFGDL